MIIDNIKNANSYKKLHKNIQKAFEFIEENDLVNMQDGRYEIAPDIFGIVQSYQTKDKNEAKAEVHRVYTDIQYMISSSEKMGYKELSSFVEDEKYNEEKDIAFSSVKNSTGLEFFTVKEGDFVIFMPQDVHMSSLNLDDGAKNVKKIIIKLKM